MVSIKITAYRLAEHSTIVNALINAARNGKQVTVVLELRARFSEEANLDWKERLEDEGVKVVVGLPNLKVHAKICVIKRRDHKRILEYGFVSTGNLNEKPPMYILIFACLQPTATSWPTLTASSVISKTPRAKRRCWLVKH